MLMVNKNRLSLFLLVLVLCLPLFSFLASQKVFAAETAQWIDNFNIKHGNATYKADDNNDNWHLFRLNDPDSCPDEIDDISWKPRNAGDKVDTPEDDDTTAVLQRRVNTATGCTDGEKIELNLTGHSTVRTGFVWDGEFIKETAANPISFKYDSQLDLYVKVGDNQCADTIKATTGAGSGQVIIRTTDKTLGSANDLRRSNDLMDQYSGHSWVSLADYANTENGCWESETVTVTLGETSNARDPGEGSVSGVDPTGDTEPSCENGGGEWSWLLCPALRIASDFLQFVDDTVNSLLLVPSEYYDNPDLEASWARMRNIAYIILVPVMLVMIISTALGFDFISAYTIKKALPRFFVAVIFIALSFEITKFLIVLTNDVGQGVLGLITSSFTGSENLTLASLFDPGGGAGFTFTAALFAGGAIAIGLVPVLLLSIASAALTLFVAFLALALRQMLLIAFMVIAPLAILAWIFPGNDKLWKLWWGSFSKLLLLFPLIMFLIGGGRVFASLVQGTNSDFLATILKLFAYVGPYFFIPAMFKLAGGAFATLTGLANDRSKGIFDRLRNQRQKEYGKAWERGKAGNYYKGDKTGRGVRGLLNKGIQAAGTVPEAGLRPTNIKRAMRNNNLQRALKAFQEDEALKSFADDAIAGAYIEGGGNRQKTEDALKRLGASQFGENWQLDANGDRTGVDLNAVARKTALENIMSTYRKYGAGEGSVGSLAAFEGLAASSTSWKNTYMKNPDGTDYLDPDTGKKVVASYDAYGKFLDTINHVAGGNRVLATQLIARGRAKQEQAGRVDIGGASFSTTVQLADALQNGTVKTEDGTILQGQAAIEEVTAQGVGDLLKGKSAAQIAQSGKEEVAVSVIPARRKMTENNIAAAKKRNVQARVDVLDGLGLQPEQQQQAAQNSEDTLNIILNATGLSQDEKNVRIARVNDSNEQETQQVIKELVAENAAHMAFSNSSVAQAGISGDQLIGQRFDLNLLPEEVSREVTKTPQLEPDPTNPGRSRPVTQIVDGRQEIVYDYPDPNTISMTHGEIHDKLRGNKWWRAYAKEYGLAEAAAGAVPGIPPPEAHGPEEPQGSPG